LALTKAAQLREHPEIAPTAGRRPLLDTWLGAAPVDCGHPQGEAFLRGVVGR
jgi:hypothetical protein